MESSSKTNENRIKLYDLLVVTTALTGGYRLNVPWANLYAARRGSTQNVKVVHCSLRPYGVNLHARAFLQNI